MRPTPAAPLGWTAPSTSIRQLLPVARAKTSPIIYTTSPFTDDAVQVGRRLLGGLLSQWDRRACAIDERVTPQPDEYVILKEHASAFAGTPLIGHLVARRSIRCCITGCSTSACVRATATDAKTSRPEADHCPRSACRIARRSPTNGRCSTSRRVSPMSSDWMRRWLTCVEYPSE